MPLFGSMSVRVRRLLLVLALVSPGVLFAPAVLAAQPGAAQVNAIRAINVEGNRRVEPETVRSYLQFAPGDAYDPAKVDGSIKALFATGLFSDVRIDRSGADVMVTPCPLCHMSLDIYQERAGRKVNAKLDLPVLHLPQMLGLAMGVPAKDLGVQRHLVPVDSIVKRVEARKAKP